MNLRHRLSRVLLAVARRLHRVRPLHAAGRRLWDAWWGLHFAVRRRLRGRFCEVPTRVGPLLVDLDDRGIGRTLYWYGDYEPGECDLLEALATPGMTALDVGANVGFHTLLLSRRVGASGRVVAVEPAPGNLRLLERNVARGAVGGNVLTLGCALADRPGELALSLDPHNAGMHRLASGRAADGDRRVAVAATTLDALVAEHRLRLDLVKMDVEGAEGKVLAGGAASLERHRPLLLMEVNPPALARLGTPVRDLLDRLAALGYHAWRLAAGGLEPAPAAWLDRLAAGDAHANLLFSPRPGNPLQEAGAASAVSSASMRSTQSSQR